MSELFKEALAETKKIKELAEADAKRKIIEEVSPFIKQMIVKETAFFFEEEEAPGVETSSENTPIVPTGAEQAAASSDIEVVEGESSVAGTDPLGIMSKTLKDLVGEEGKIAIDPSGKITIEPASSGVDLTKAEESTTTELGAGSPPPVELAPPATPAPEAPVATATPVPTAPAVAPAEAPAEAPAAEEVPATPVAAAPIAESYRAFQINLGETALKIDELYFSKKPSQLLAESLKNKLFNLLENLDSLSESGKINKTQFVLNEKKLEFLFEKLKEAKTGNSYSIKGNKDMGSLKEFASKLFEGDEKSLAHDAASTGKTGVAVHAAATAQAKKVSGVAPGVDLFDNQQTVEDLHGEALPGVGDAEDPDGWENAETLEINEADLLEAVRALRGKGKKVVKESSELDEAVITLELPDDLDLDADDVSLSVSSDDMESEEEEEDELELDLEDEEVEEEDEEDAADEEEEEEEEVEEEEEEEEEEDEMEEEEKGMLYGEEGAVEEEALMESVLRSRATKRAKLLESKLHKTVHAASKVKKLAESRNRELQTMKEEMAETNLFLSKVLLLNKFLQREDLTQKQKQVIVEHLDRAQTIAEAKEIYVKIKNKLNEAVAKGTVRTGSASAPVSSGAASFKVISESANQGNDIVLGTPERWALLVKGRRED